MDRAQKNELIASLKQALRGSSVIVVVHNQGLSAAQIASLRRQVKDAGVTFKVAKNRLVRLALVDTPFAHAADLFTGPTGVAFAKDPVSAAKVMVQFAKQHDKLVVLGGALGPRKLDVDGVKALAALPSLDELRGKLVGLLVAPATKVAQVVKAPSAKLARVVSAYATKDQAA